MPFIFFASLALLAYAYAGYPLLLMLAAAVAARPVKKEDLAPAVSILVSAHDEDKAITEKIEGLLRIDYPRDKMEIIVGSDGSSDEAYRAVRKFSDENKIRYTVSFQRIGKPALLNKMAKEAQGDIYVFADLRQRIEQNALRELVKPFADEDVGAVIGELAVEGRGQSYEGLLRRLESALGSVLGADGAIHAIRREHFRYLPEDVVADDAFIPMNAVLLKKRAVFEPLARACGPVSEAAEKEFMHKVRGLVGDLQILGLFSEALNPFRSKVAFQLFSHKLLRLATPYFLISLLTSNIFLAKEGGFFILMLLLQAVFYGLAALGVLLEMSEAKAKGVSKALQGPYEFCVLSAAAVVALAAYMSGAKITRSVGTAALLLFFCFFGQAGPLWAQNAPTAEILRSEELLEKEKRLRDEIEKDKKAFIKEIVVQGAALPEAQIEEITAPFKEHWLSKEDIAGLIAQIKDACVKNGYSEAALKITYQVRKSTLTITVKL